MYNINWIVFGIGLFFSITETAYFGWNFAPQSEAELICDGLSSLIVAMAFT